MQTEHYMANMGRPVEGLPGSDRPHADAAPDLVPERSEAASAVVPSAAGQDAPA